MKAFAIYNFVQKEVAIRAWQSRPDTIKIYFIRESLHRIDSRKL